MVMEVYSGTTDVDASPSDREGSSARASGVERVGGVPGSVERDTFAKEETVGVVR